MEPTHSLRARTEEVLRQALAACRAHPALHGLAKEIQVQMTRIGEPMRVAIVGTRNSGKSTLTNALLGDYVALTGNYELTARANWFRHGETAKLIVHATDGSEYELPLHELESLTDQTKADQEQLDRIRWIEVIHPSEMLRQFDLVDTPGLHSFFQNDSQNTLELLTSEESRPHALVMVFDKEMKDYPFEDLKRFQDGQGNLISGLTAIGVLTKVDGNPAQRLSGGETVIQKFRKNHPVVADRLFDILPVSALAGLGAQTIAAEEVSTLCEVAVLPDDEREMLLADAKQFETEEYPESLATPSANRRAKLAKRMGRYGIAIAIESLLAGRKLEEVMADVFSASNLASVRALLTGHFGNRAFLIKCGAGMERLHQAAQTIIHAGGPGRAGALQVRRLLTEILSDARYYELRVLQRHYRNELRNLDRPCVEEMLRLTGEHGLDCAARLGQPADTPVDKLTELAARNAENWHARAVRHTGRDQFEEAEACRDLASACTLLADRLREICRLRGAADELWNFGY